MAGVADAARAIKKVIDRDGEISEEEAKDLAAQAGVPDEQVKFALLYGSGKGRRWWKREDGYLVAVNRNGTSNGHTPDNSIPDIDLSELATLETQKERAEVLLRTLGVAERAAKGSAAMMDAFDLANPQELKEALELTSLSPTTKRQFFVTWSRSQGLPLSADDLRAFQPQGGAHQANTPQQTQAPAVKQYVVMGGKPVLAPDGEGEYTFREAMQVCELQVRQAQAARGDEDNPNLIAQLIASQAQVFEGMLEKSQAESRHALELIQATLRKDESADPIGALNKVLPGVSGIFQKAVDSILSPASPGPLIKLGSGEGSLPFNDYIRLEEMQLKRQATDTVMKTLPDLVAAGLAAARTLDGETPAAQRPAREQPPQQPQEPAMYQLACVGCGVALGVPADMQIFNCVECGTPQDVHGNSLAAPENAQDPAIEAPEEGLMYNQRGESPESQPRRGRGKSEKQAKLHCRPGGSG